MNVISLQGAFVATKPQSALLEKLAAHTCPGRQCHGRALATTYARRRRLPRVLRGGCSYKRKKHGPRCCSPYRAFKGEL